MKRWTVLFIPHDTDEPRSVAVSSRALRWMGAGVAIVAVAAIVGVGAIASWAARTGEGTMRAQRAKCRLKWTILKTLASPSRTLSPMWRG